MNIQMGPSHDRWHYERSEKRPLRCADALVMWLDKMPHLSLKSSLWFLSVSAHTLHPKMLVEMEQNWRLAPLELRKYTSGFQIF